LFCAPFWQVYQRVGEPCGVHLVGGRGLAQLPSRVPVGLQNSGTGQLPFQLHHRVHPPVR